MAWTRHSLVRSFNNLKLLHALFHWKFPSGSLGHLRNLLVGILYVVSSWANGVIFDSSRNRLGVFLPDEMASVVLFIAINVFVRWDGRWVLNFAAINCELPILAFRSR
jgi:hypothetical protein